MKVIAVISQKGGSGKTTLASNLGVAAQQAGSRTAIVDTDPQQSVRFWGDKRPNDGPGPEVLGDHAKRLPRIIETAADAGFDVLVIDTQPRDSGDALLACKVADIILIPCRPAAYDLHAIADTLGTTKEARKPAFVVLNSAPIRSAMVDQAREYLEGQGATVAPVIVRQRVAFSHSVLVGQTALEFEPDGKAAEEINELWAWVCAQLELEPVTRKAA